MSELISEIDAFVAWKNGQDVEIYDESMCWHTLCRDHGLCVFDSNGRVKFRLKPNTIVINGIEVPAPFEPKDGDVVWVISDYRVGYREVQYNKSIYNAFGAWRTEDEIKQVIAAFRSIFNVK